MKIRTGKHPSNSNVQISVEHQILKKLGTELGCELLPKSLVSLDGRKVEIDGYSDKPKILCEIYAHIGGLKGSQYRKPITDAVKLLLAEKWLGGNWRKLLVFVDEEARGKFDSGTWYSEAIKNFGIETCVISLSPAAQLKISKAQKRQRMENASD